MSKLTIPATPKINTPAPAAKPAAAQAKTFKVSTGTRQTSQRVGIYGESGAGKSTLTAECERKTLFLDLQRGTRNLDVHRIEGIEKWDDLRAVVRDKQLLTSYDVLAIDTGTEAQDLAEQWTVANIPNDKGKFVQSLKHYGYGEGYLHLYDTFCLFLQDLDAAVDWGTHIVLILHATPERVPNPAGDDYLQVQPRLLRAKNADLRARVREWLDHLLYLEIARDLTEGGKIRSSYRLLHPVELPHAWAKSRTLTAPLPFELGNGDSIWQQIIK